MFHTLLNAEEGNTFDVIVVCPDFGFAQRTTLKVDYVRRFTPPLEPIEYGCVYLVGDELVIQEKVVKFISIRIYEHPDVYGRKLCSGRYEFSWCERRENSRRSLQLDIIPYKECLSGELQKVRAEIKALVETHSTGAALLESTEAEDDNTSRSRKKQLYGYDSIVKDVLRAFKERTEQLMSGD